MRLTVGNIYRVDTGQGDQSVVTGKPNTNRRVIYRNS